MPILIQHIPVLTLIAILFVANSAVAEDTERNSLSLDPIIVTEQKLSDRSIRIEVDFGENNNYFIEDKSILSAEIEEDARPLRQWRLFEF